MMNYDEFSFVNQQLATMLREGIPLEGALRQMAATMHRSPLREELKALEADLASGQPLREAIRARKLPAFYKNMLQAGTQTHDFPGVLTLLADYYQRMNLVWTRLKGIMVYPAILLGCSLALAAGMVFLNGFVEKQMLDSFHTALTFSRHGQTTGGASGMWDGNLRLKMYLPPVTLTVMLLVAGLLTSWRPIRLRLEWRLPAFREAHLAEFAASMELLLRAGCPLPEAVALLEDMEGSSPLGRELAQWRERAAAGHTKIAGLAEGSQCLPPLFLWLVGGAGEDLAHGFKRAAEIYQARAAYRTEMLLYAALPTAICVMGLMVFAQIYPLVAANFQALNGIFRMSEIIH
jgi:type II secretory pathway component PulF